MGWMMKVALVPAWTLLVLVVAGGVIALTGARALAESTDWRADVQGPMDGVADIIAKQLAELSNAPTSPYRGEVQASVSTGLRIPSSVEAAEADDAPPEGSAERKARR